MKRKTTLFSKGKTGERGNVVDDTVGEGRSRADKKNCVAVDEPRDAGYVDGVRRARAGDKMEFDVEVEARFSECGMGSFWKDPAVGIQ